MERPVVFWSQERLVGVLHEPEGAARGAGVVFLHGWAGYRGGPHRMFLETARRLAEAGYHALRFDFLWSTPLFAPYKKRSQEAARRGMFLADYARKLFRRETWAKLARGQVHFGLIARILLGRRKPAGQRDPKDSLRDIMEDLRGYRGRALFIYGSRDDEAIGAPEFYADYCRQEGIPARFHTIEGANHSYYSAAWQEEVIDLTLKWLIGEGE